MQFARAISLSLEKGLHGLGILGWIIFEFQCIVFLVSYRPYSFKGHSDELDLSPH